MHVTPEQLARQNIDALLEQAGWCVQNLNELNLFAGEGVAVREVSLKSGHGSVDYLLYVNQKAVGVIEAKAEGKTLAGIEVQASRYSEGIPDGWPAPITPLPFIYITTGVETTFTNMLDPEPRSRRVFTFHRPGTLAGWLDAPASADVAAQPSTLRSRFQHFPEVVSGNLWPVQVRAVGNLEKSLARSRQRSLIQMATGSGKTFTAINSTYRMIKHARAKRILFLVDRSNLGKQALKEFQQYDTPDDGRKFTELYNVQRLGNNKLDSTSKVCISTIQRLYSILSGEEEMDGELDESSHFEGGELRKEPMPVVYNQAVPPEFFDIIFIDECHRSIFNLWRQVLDYFDAFLVGLTATPDKRAFGFFNGNLVMEYGHEQAVVDRVNVDFDVYRIRTKITEEGSKVEAAEHAAVGKRDRLTRKTRWEELEDDLVYDASKLDRDVVAKDQIRTVVQTFKNKLFTEIFPGRTEVPKTLVFAKDDSHADDIVDIMREVFDKGNDFCQKITYRTSTVRVVENTTDEDGNEKETITYKSSGINPDDLLSSFRNSYNPRIVVTVDMIATGTDVKPLEIVMFMRQVKSRTYFEQMKGRGVRVINPTDLLAVSPDAKHGKSHFVIVDCVGVCETEKSDTVPLDRKKTIGFEKLMEHVSFGNTDPELLSSLASRLIRLDKQLDEPERESLAAVANGKSITLIAADLLKSIDPDYQRQQAKADLPPGEEPSDEQVAAKAQELKAQAAAPISANPKLREQLVLTKQRADQIIDEESKDEVLEAGASEESKEKAKQLIGSFRKYIEDNRDEITALQILYSKRHPSKLHFEDIKQLAQAINAPPHGWSPAKLWHAYEVLERDRVRGAGAKRLLTDLVSLVRFTLEQDEMLLPFGDHVRSRYDEWWAGHEGQGREFTEEQRQWIILIRDHIAANVEITRDDFELGQLKQAGGLYRASALFGNKLDDLLDELNRELVA